VLYFAFLRAINVGGAKVAMADLRGLMVVLGLRNGRTLLNTGNLIFESDEPSDALEAVLKREAEARLGLKTEFIIRSGAELEAVVSNNPYPREAVEDPSHLVVLFASGPVSASGSESLRGAIRGREVFAGSRRDLYVYYPDGIGHSKLTNQLIERHLGVRVTGRNWNTVRKLTGVVPG
jgi:uncharacterized protein (DUF1697 family)